MMVKVIAGGIAGVIAAINTVLGMTIKMFANSEKFSTRTKYNISLAEKTAIA
jgi:hypothetical protein